jgi:hypothetical protein
MRSANPFRLVTSALVLALLSLSGCGGEPERSGPGGERAATDTERGETAGERAPAAVALADDRTPVPDTLVVYKTATCGCCKDWIEHMEENGFTVVAHDYQAVELNNLKLDAGVKSDLASCHTALVAGYVVEGHVPADLVKRMLAERPQITGLAVPGMPVGSPGMEGPIKQDYRVIAFKRDGAREVYAER